MKTPGISVRHSLLACLVVMGFGSQRCFGFIGSVLSANMGYIYTTLSLASGAYGYLTPYLTPHQNLESMPRWQQKIRTACQYASPALLGLGITSCVYNVCNNRNYQTNYTKPERKEKPTHKDIRGEEEERNEEPPHEDVVVETHRKKREESRKPQEAKEEQPSKLEIDTTLYTLQAKPKTTSQLQRRQPHAGVRNPIEKSKTVKLYTNKTDKKEFQTKQKENRSQTDLRVDSHTDTSISSPAAANRSFFQRYLRVKDYSCEHVTKAIFWRALEAGAHFILIGDVTVNWKTGLGIVKCFLDGSVAGLARRKTFAPSIVKILFNLGTHFMGTIEGGAIEVALIEALRLVNAAIYRKDKTK